MVLLTVVIAMCGYGIAKVYRWYTKLQRSSLIEPTGDQSGKSENLCHLWVIKLLLFPFKINLEQIILLPMNRKKQVRQMKKRQGIQRHKRDRDSKREKCNYNILNLIKKNYLIIFV